LIYRSKAEYSTQAAKVRKTPGALTDALNNCGAWLDSVGSGQPQKERFVNAMKTLDILATAPEILSSELLSGVEIPEDATLQQRVVMADVVKATALMERIETMIASAEENYVNRHGETSVIPMRVDSTAKLLHAWTRLADVRATRSGVATSITESRAKVEKSEKLDVSVLLSDPASAEAAHILTERMAAQRPKPDAKPDAQK
jgi:hypothetical protein